MDSREVGINGYYGVEESIRLTVMGYDYHCAVLAAPRISDLSVTSCVVDWTPLKPLGADSLVYVLQLQRISSRGPDYHEVSLVVAFANSI